MNQESTKNDEDSNINISKTVLHQLNVLVLKIRQLNCDIICLKNTTKHVRRLIASPKDSGPSVSKRLKNTENNFLSSSQHLMAFFWPLNMVEYTPFFENTWVAPLPQTLEPASVAAQCCFLSGKCTPSESFGSFQCQSRSFCVFKRRNNGTGDVWIPGE